MRIIALFVILFIGVSVAGKSDRVRSTFDGVILSNIKKICEKDDLPTERQGLIPGSYHEQNRIDGASIFYTL